MGFINVLHTNTKYACFGNNLLTGITNDSELIIRSRFESAIANLEAQELSFYNQFGFDSAVDFFRAIRALVQSSSIDMLILQKFNAETLGPILDTLKNPFETLDTFYIVVDNSQARKELEPLLQQLAISNATIDIIPQSTKLGISGRWRLDAMKELVSATQKRHKFGSDSPAETALIKYLSNGADGLIEFYIDEQHFRQKEPIEFKSSPFAYGSEDLKSFDTNKIKQIQDDIHSFIFSRIGINSGSSALQKAANSVWNNTIAKMGVEFFIGGAGGLKSWKRNVIGNLGEFQTAVFFQYFADVCSSPQMGKKVAEIIGSDRNAAKEKLRNDVTLLNAFGVQVKNYNSDIYNKFLKGGGTETKQRTIDVKMHPMQIPSITSDNELLNYVMNSYFNIDFGPPSEGEWEIFFKNHADEVLNMNGYKPEQYNDPYGFVDFSDKATFYMIRGHFIPGSVIMRGAMEQKINVSNTTVSAKYKHDSAYYRADEEKNKSHLLKWWIYRENVSPAVWEPTDENTLSAWDSNISIKTSFEYQNIIKSITGGIYKIF